MYEINRPATVKDALHLANNLRAEDRKEVLGLGHTPLVLPACVSKSNGTAVSMFRPDNGDLAGIAGVMPGANKGEGIIWMVCTPAIEGKGLLFVRNAKRWLKEIEQDYDYLWNLADARNHFHHKLLKMLGFRAIREVYPAPYYLPYYEIIKLCASPSSD